MTRKKAYSLGVYAAHEEFTPLCPFSWMYEKQLYDAWYAGLAAERRRLYSQGDLKNENR